MATSNVTKRSRAKTAQRARSDLRLLAAYLWQEATLVPPTPDKERLRWAATAIRAFLMGLPTAPTLEHAFGLVRSRGNPGGDSNWADIAADADARKLTTAEVIAGLPHRPDGRVPNENVVRENLKRGREAYRRRAVEAAVDRATAAVDVDLEAERATRIETVRLFNADHGITLGRKRRRP
jgi:hypothetical protein